MKFRKRSREEIPFIQGKEQRLYFTGATLKRYRTPKVREKVKVKSESEVAQSCPTLCNTVDSSPPGSSTHGILEARYWSGLPFPSPVDHILSDLSTMTRPSWVAPLAWLSFIELDKAVVLV